MEKSKIELIAPIEVVGEKDYKKIFAALSLPEEDSRQIDLQYITPLLVSSGENLNHAYFLPSELISAEHSIINKAVDVEHDEQKVVGHIYDKAYMWKEEASVFDTADVRDREDLDELEIDIAIAGVLYRDRFPEVAKEVAEGKWKVSMECFYDDFDLKIGDLIIPGEDALALGYDAMVGKFTIVKEHGEEKMKDVVSRILRGIVFCGCGLVESPANPTSLILEAASIEDKIAYANKENLIINLESCEEYMKRKQEGEKISVSLEAAEKNSGAEEEEKKENSDAIAIPDDTISPGTGLCPHYKRQVLDETSTDPNKPVLHENWCMLYDEACTVPAAPRAGCAVGAPGKHREAAHPASAQRAADSGQ